MSPTTDKHAWRFTSSSSRWLERRVDPTWRFRWAVAAETDRFRTAIAEKVESVLMFGPRSAFPAATYPTVAAYFAGPDKPLLSSRAAAKYLSDILSIVLWYIPADRTVQRLVGRSPVQWKYQPTAFYPRLTINQSNGLFDRQYATPEEVEFLYGEKIGAESEVAKPAPVPFEELMRQLEEG